MAAGGAEEHFAKKLANNEKIIRDRAVNKLRAWIRSRPKGGPGFGEVDLLKIWKGLFYCMWMSDKPLIQEELALNISQLVLSFKNEQSAVLFIKAFFKTIQREWHGIDRLRLDKFYMLIRFFVKETFNFLKKAGWEDRLVSDVSNIFHEEPMNPNSQTVPDGIRLHMVSVYLAELGSVIDDQVTASAVLKLLDPLFLLAAHSKNTTVTSAVGRNLFEQLVQEVTDDPEDQQNSKIKVDFAAVADRLFTLASDRNILGRNRNQLFEWSKRLRKYSTGEHSEENPGQQDTSLNGNPVGSKRKAEEQESSDVTNTNELQDNKGENSHTKEGKQKRKKNKHTNKITEKEQDEPEDEAINEQEKKDGKRKRKSSQGNVGHVESSLGKGVPAAASKSEPKKKKKKKSLVDNDNRTTITKSVDTVHKNGVEESVTTNGDDEDMHAEHKSDKGIINSLSEGDSSALNGDLRLSTENDDQTLTSTVESKVLHKAAYHNGEPFAKFQKNSTPPAFVRRCPAKTPSTEPRKSKTSNKKVQPPGSAPSKGTQKRVRLEMSKNTSHTAQDYQRSVKESPKIPFDAEKTPTQGLLKSPPRPQRTPLFVKKAASASTDSGQQQKKKKQPKVAQRPRAFDFF